MNNTYFYQVQIGKYTRSGNLQSHVAFVCMSAEKSQYKISEHYQKVYKGFDVLVLPVTEIVEVQPVSEKLESVSSEQSQLVQKVKELREENAIDIMQENIEFLCCQSMAELAKHYLSQLKRENVLPVSMQKEYCERIINHFEKLKSDAGVVNT